jgi:hypothetical protein
MTFENFKVFIFFAGENLLAMFAGGAMAPPLSIRQELESNKLQ